MSRELRTVEILLKPAEYEALERIGIGEGKSVPEVIVEIIQRYLVEQGFVLPNREPDTRNLDLHSDID